MTACVLGFDYGSKRIGIAVGQSITATANPLTQITAKKGQPDWLQCDKIIQQWQPARLIVGLPLNMDGTESRLSQATKHFAQQLQTRYDCLVELVDERLSSREAQDMLIAQQGNKYFSKTQTNRVAAQVILQSWLNNLQNSDI